MASKLVKSIINDLGEHEFKILHRFAVTDSETMSRSDIARPLKMSKHNFETALSTLTLLGVIETHTGFTAARGRNPQLYMITTKGETVLAALKKRGIIGK